MHFGLSGPSIRYMYSWDFTVSGKTTMFICTDQIVTSPIVLFVRAQSYPVLCTVYAGNDVGGCLGSGIVSMWLSMILWPFSHIPLVLFMWNIGTLNVIPSYGCNSFACTSVLSGMTWISVWGGCLFARPGVIMNFDFLITL